MVYHPHACCDAAVASHACCDAAVADACALNLAVYSWDVSSGDEQLSSPPAVPVNALRNRATSLAITEVQAVMACFINTVNAPVIVLQKCCYFVVEVVAVIAHAAAQRLHSTLHVH